VLNYGLVNHLVDMFTRPSPGLHLAATKTLNILAANNTEARKPLQDGNVLARVVAVLQNGARGDGGGVGWGGASDSQPTRLPMERPPGSGLRRA
jgi:hypothetical protein